MPAKTTTDQSTVSIKLMDKIVGQLDLNKISSSLAESLVKRLLESLDVNRLADVVFERHGTELQEGLVNAIIAHL